MHTSAKQLPAAPPAKAAAGDSGQGSQAPSGEGVLPPLPAVPLVPRMPLPMGGCGNVLPAMVGCTGGGALGPPNLFQPARAPPSTYYALVARTSAILQRMATSLQVCGRIMHQAADSFNAELRVLEGMQQELEGFRPPLPTGRGGTTDADR